MKYILFDLDGTLADTSPGILNSIAKALKLLGWPEMDMSSMRRFIGPPLKDAFMDFCGMTEHEAQEVVNGFRTFYDKDGKLACVLYPGIENMLRVLKGNGFHLFVATSKPTIFAAEILEYLGIATYFEDIVGSNLDNTRSKKREVIQYILDKHYITQRDSVVMVGDKAQDLIGAKQCGIRGIGISYGFGGSEELLTELHEAILDSPAELVEYLLSV